MINNTSIKLTIANGILLPIINSHAVIGLTVSCSNVPDSFSCTIAIPESITVTIIKSIASIDGTKKFLLSKLLLNHVLYSTSTPILFL